MVIINKNTKVMFYGEPISFRLGINSISTIVESFFPKSADRENTIFVFISKDNKGLKIYQELNNTLNLYYFRTKKKKFLVPFLENSTVKIDIKMLEELILNLEIKDTKKVVKM